jgi:5-carboxymethyl-2-hydroxymuconate isomerase
MLNFCGIVAASLKMATGRHFPISRINSGHHNLPTYEISLKSDNVEYVHFQNDRRNTGKIQHCSISKVAFDLFFKLVVSDSGRFERLETS